MSLTGELADFSVAELLQILCMGRKSGLLGVQGDRVAGRIFLVEGQLTHATTDQGAEGEAAFRELARAQNGRFSFVSHRGEQQWPVSITRPLQALLLEESECGSG
jgi:hypothetical protein